MKKILEVLGPIIVGVSLAILGFKVGFWIVYGFALGLAGLVGVIAFIIDTIKKRKERVSTRIEKLKTASFWIGVFFLSIPLLMWFFGNFGVYRTYQHTCEGQRSQMEDCIACRAGAYNSPSEASLDDIIHAKSRGLYLEVIWPGHFFEIIDDDDFVPFALLFGVGCGLIIFSIFNQKWRTEESIVAVVTGVLVWIYLVINIFAGDWWWLNWCLLAIFGAALIIFGFRNLLEE